MRILGIANTIDSGVCLIEDGKLIFAANEERFNREKLTRKFPNQSISFILEKYKLSAENIDFVGCGAWKGISDSLTLESLCKDIAEISRQSILSSNYVVERVSSSIKTNEENRIEFETDQPSSPKSPRVGRKQVENCGKSLTK